MNHSYGVFPQPPDLRLDEPLPPGWEMRIDDRTNWPFFINHQTQTTTWTDPRPIKNNAPKQPRVIPVQHEQAPTTQQQWQGHHPYQMPQPQQSGHMRMPQPQQFQQQYQEQHPFMNSQTQHPSQFSNQHQGNRPYSPHQSRGEQPTERTIPIQVVHETPEESSRVANAPRNTEAPTRNVPIVRSPPPRNATMSKQPQPSVGVKKQMAADPKPEESRDVPTSTPPETAASTSTASDDDHRVVEARKRITAVLNDIETKEQEVDNFTGSRTDKEFVRLEHELTNKLLHLDEVSAAGAPGENNIRAQRKAAIKRVQQTLDILELKVLD